ncbi:MAG: aminotransferase class I/II-fold pyridoxal phosphate-dependent enzyme [Candidatus Aenigmarchaeota archaeon]|nr:aminotransferase class I/II-fold pyridoxal phosphate-dependent enzyme [Candidatus Aenigmarchaeota archaeon]
MENKIRPSKVLSELPPYLFSRIDRMAAGKRKKGMDVISFGVGDPDLPTPKNIIDAINDASKDPKNYRYPTYEGKMKFRQAVSGFYRRRWNVDLDPASEVMASIGAKESIHNAAFAMAQGKALVPNPAYTVYFSSARFSGHDVVEFPLKKENSFLPDLSFLESHSNDAVYMWINYPNNPTAATLTKEELGKIVHFCRENGIALFYDNTYSELSYDGYKPPSPLEFGKKGILEFHSLSKTYSMSGFRLGWVCGDPDLVNMVLSVKKNIDSGVAGIIQDAGIEALNGPQDKALEYSGIYARRRDLLLTGLGKAGLEAEKPKATFYIWAKVPDEYIGKDSPSMSFVENLLDRAGVLATPGVGFGRYGEGYVRFALTQTEERIKEALERIRRI